MVLLSSSPPIPRTRKIVAHKKSRKGCGNCRLRSVKCDETRPGCKRCTAYGVSCSYDRALSDLQLHVEQTTAIKLLQSVPLWPNKIDQLLSKFQMRTALTISTGDRLQMFQGPVVAAAYSCPFLMHAILALTLMHDRHLSVVPDTALSNDEIFHWYRATTSFNKQLSSSVAVEQQLPLLTTAALLGTIVFYHVDATTSEEAWPLRPPSQSDLDWLKMSKGKQEVYKLIEPLNHDPGSHILASAHPGDAMCSSSPSLATNNSLPPDFILVYNLATPPCNDFDDAYHSAASQLAEVMDPDCPPFTVMVAFAIFTSTIQSSFKRLLELKDGRALLLLAFWYAKVYRLPVWWVSRRARMEGQAICVYLERFCGHDVGVQRLLRYPKAMLYSGAPV